MADQRFGRRRGGDAARVPTEQRRVQVEFQVVDPLADRRSRDVLALRRPGQAAQVVDG